MTLRIAANLVAAFGAALFARAGLQYYSRTHSLIGAIFLFEELWVVVAYLVRRPARVVSQRPLDWLLAFGGTFGGVLLRPAGAHPHWGVVAGFDLQLIGLVLCVASFAALGRSFGFAAADRGLKQRGPYSVIRHPIYASYFLLLIGYLLQSLSWQNALVVAIRLQLQRRAGPRRRATPRIQWRLRQVSIERSLEVAPGRVVKIACSSEDD